MTIPTIREISPTSEADLLRERNEQGFAPWSAPILIRRDNFMPQTSN